MYTRLVVGLAACLALSVLPTAPVSTAATGAAAVAAPVAAGAAGAAASGVSAPGTRPAAYAPRGKDGKVKPWRDHTWMPRLGPEFNNPIGKRRQRSVLVRRIEQAIRHTPRGETIRFAQYSFDKWSVARALMQAHERGVNVQVILNDNWTSGATKRMRRVIGRDRSKGSFVHICKRSCRGGGPGNLHLKVYSFTRTGAAHHLVMTGSTNLTQRAIDLQYNDLVTFQADQAFWDTWLGVFEQLRSDTPHRGWITHESPWLSAVYYRLPAPNRDPVMQDLKDIDCQAAPGSGNAQGRTVIRIIMYAWLGRRGLWLAHRVAALARQGCDVRAILSVPGGRVVGILRRAGVALRSADWKYLKDAGVSRDNPEMVIDVVDFYSHIKALMVDGSFDGQPKRMTWTGSENWSSLSFSNDELTLQFDDPTIHAAYTAQFDQMWHGKATHRFGIEPDHLPGQQKRRG